MKKDDQQPNETGGIIAVVASAAVVVVDIFVPARKGADPADTYYIAAFALMLAGWGFRQIHAARRKKKRLADAAKKKDD